MLVRENMVACQVYTSGVTDERLLEALRSVPRERFVPPSLRSVAYADIDLPLEGQGMSGEGRFLMAPTPFARLVQLGNVQKDSLVLDVGCGTGYASAVLSILAGSVVSLESNPTLSRAAEENFLSVGADNVAVVMTDQLSEGYPSEGPYDCIFMGGMVDSVPETLLNQCKDGGSLVAVISHEGIGQGTVFRWEGGVLSCRHVFDADVRFLSGFSANSGFSF